MSVPPKRVTLDPNLMRSVADSLDRAGERIDALCASKKRADFGGVGEPAGSGRYTVMVHAKTPEGKQHLHQVNAVPGENPAVAHRNATGFIKSTVGHEPTSAWLKDATDIAAPKFSKAVADKKYTEHEYGSAPRKDAAEFDHSQAEFYHRRREREGGAKANLHRHAANLHLNAAASKMKLTGDRQDPRAVKQYDADAKDAFAFEQKHDLAPRPYYGG